MKFTFVECALIEYKTPAGSQCPKKTFSNFQLKFFVVLLTETVMILVYF